jgi:alpha-galactosidase
VGGNLWRTTGDIGDRWQSMENIGFGTAIPGPERGAPGLTQLDIAKYSNVGHWNDPDMLEIGNGGMTTDEYKTHFTLWSILRAPLLAGNDIRNMKPEISEILLNTEMIAINQDPAGLEPKLASREGKVDILTRPLKDKSYVVGIFNRGDDEAPVKVTWSAIGLKGKLRGRDLWKHQDIDVSGDTYAVKVPKHGVVALRVSAK